MEQAPAQYKAGHTSTPPPAYSGNTTSNPLAASSQADDSTASLPAPPSETSHLSAQHKAAHVPNASLADSGSTTSNRLVSSTQEDDSSASLIAQPRGASQTPAQANPDVLLAEQGDAFAQYRLGRFFAQQSGSHSPESVSWYRKASDGLRQLALTGNGKAMYVLGVMYAFGRGVVQNREEARSWLAQALAHQVPAAGPVLASLDKYRPADPNPPITVQAKRRQT
jgi:TPR repeat protein